MKRFRQVFKEEEDFLPTFNDQLDDLQVGGFPAGCVTELVGESGSGKTQLCLQLCANVQVPAEIGGLEGKAVFFDCHGGFSKRRFDEIATATKGIALDILRDSENASEAELEEFAKKDFGVGLLYRKMHSSSDLLESLKQLESEILPKNPEIRLVIIDSIAFHFRYLLNEVENNVTGTLFQVIQKLNELTSKWNLISVVTNQMTVRKPFFENGCDNTNVIAGNEECLLPALGETWTYACSSRILLSFVQVSRAEGFITNRSISRKMEILKSSRFESGKTATFCITGDGIRTLED